MYDSIESFNFLKDLFVLGATTLSFPTTWLPVWCFGTLDSMRGSLIGSEWSLTTSATSSATEGFTLTTKLPCSSIALKRWSSLKKIDSFVDISFWIIITLMFIFRYSVRFHSIMYVKLLIFWMIQNWKKIRKFLAVIFLLFELNHE